MVRIAYSFLCIGALAFLSCNKIRVNRVSSGVQKISQCCKSIQSIGFKKSETICIEVQVCDGDLSSAHPALNWNMKMLFR